MEANQYRQPDSLKIPEGGFFELYTPVVGGVRIISPSLGYPLQFAKIHLTADADVTFKDEFGNLSTAVPLSKGEQSFLVTEIRVVSTGSVYIRHDGKKWETSKTFATNIYANSNSTN